MKFKHKAVLLLIAVLGCGRPSPTSSRPSDSIKVPSARLRPTGWAPTPVEPREAVLAAAVGRILQQEHLTQAAINDALSRKAFAVYLRKLDGGKLLLLRQHVAVLRQYAERIDDELRNGNLELARMGAGLLAVRRKFVEKMVAELLVKPFDFNRVETFETDPDKRKYCADDRELRDRWRKALKLEVLERISRMQRLAKSLADDQGKSESSADNKKQTTVRKKLAAKIPRTFEAREKKARSDLAKSYSGRFKRLAAADPLDPARRYLNAITSVYDPHTLYMLPADRANFDIAMSGSLEGIGALLSEEDHFIVVRDLVPGGASWRQGMLEVGDLILAVAQAGKAAVDVADMPIDQVVKMIRGPKGTVVTLTVRKADKRIQAISITRDVVVVEAAYARGALLDRGEQQAKAGYIFLPSFYGSMRDQPGAAAKRNAADDVRKLLVKFAKQKLPGVILDLRGNSGGLLGQAAEITGLFIPTGPVVQTKASKGELEVLSDRDPSVDYHGKVVVLVDRFSASASEIVAGALQDYGRAIIVGTGPTHGKGTVQLVVDLNRLRASEKVGPLGILKLTIQQYFRITGDSVQWRGVTPDIVLPDPQAYVESSERLLDNSIPSSQINAAPFKSWKKPVGKTDQLVQKSKARIDSVAVFDKINARTKTLKKLIEQTKLPLQLKAWRARQEQYDAALKAYDLELQKGDSRFKVTIVPYDKGKPPAVKPSDQKRKGGKGNRLSKWRKELSRDPWVEESLHVLDDMGSVE